MTAHKLTIDRCANWPDKQIVSRPSDQNTSDLNSPASRIHIASRAEIVRRGIRLRGGERCDRTRGRLDVGPNRQPTSRLRRAVDTREPPDFRYARRFSILVSMSSPFASMLSNSESTCLSNSLGASRLQSPNSGPTYISRAAWPSSACSAALTSLTPANCSRLRPIRVWQRDGIPGAAKTGTVDARHAAAARELGEGGPPRLRQRRPVKGA